MPLQTKSDHPAKHYVGAIAIEDDAVYFTVAEVDRRPGVVVAASPHVTRIPRPPAGYSVEFIETCMRKLDQQNIVPLSGVGISMFGTIRTDDDNRGNIRKVDREDALIAVPRLDWLSPDQPPLIFKNLVEAWKEVPVFVQNDCTTSALTDYYKQDDRSNCPGYVYVRLGTGIGGGVLWNGVPRPGKIHPEIGHIPVIRRSDDTLATSKCKVHQKHGCLEGFVSEAAILERVDAESVQNISKHDPIWELLGWYLGQLCATILMTLAPDRISIGGRTMRDATGRVRAELYQHIHTSFKEIVSGYPRYQESEAVETFIRPAEAWLDPSLWGAVELARQGIVPPTLREVTGSAL